MSAIDVLRYRVGRWLRRSAYERELAEEIRLHLELDAGQHGGDPGDARLRFGNVTHVGEEARHVAGLDLFDNVNRDVRYVLRSLRRSPGFAAVTILTLALGIGATTAVVSIVDHVLIHSLPFRDQSRLMEIFESREGGRFRLPSNPTVKDWREDPGAQAAFEGVSFARLDGVVLGTADGPKHVGMAFVDSAFFSVLGATPKLGRTLTAADLRPDTPPTVVLTDAFWNKQFGGDPTIIGRRITLDSVPTTVVGVMPPGTAYPGHASAWEPVTRFQHQDILLQRGVHVDSRTVARLRPGVDSARAVALMQPIARRLGEMYSADQAHWSVGMWPLEREIIGDVQPMLMTLAAAAAGVLLLACANIANVLMARAAARSRELAIRGAIGASRGRLIRQLLTESLVLAAAGGTLGTAAAAVVVRLARQLPVDQLPRAGELAVDHRVLVVALAALVLTVMLCGVWPALHATKADASETLRAGGAGSLGMRSDSRLRRTLVTFEFSLALVLLAGAGLLLQSFRRAAAVDLGFEPHGLITTRILLPAGSYQRPAEAAALYGRLIDAARGVPGVTDAAFSNHIPFVMGSSQTTVDIDGAPSASGAQDWVVYRTVSDGYLQTMKMGLAAGRWFTKEDMLAPGGSFVINETMARRAWAGQLAVGKHLTLHRASQGRADLGQPLPGTVIGVVHDVNQSQQDAAITSEVYVPYTLETWPFGDLVIRAQDVVRAIPMLQVAIASVDPRLISKGAAGAKELYGLDGAVADALKPRELSLSVVGAFAICALLLAGLGLYGIVAFGVVQRTRELGVRKALGATNGMIARLMLRESFALTGLGIVIGCAGAWAAARLVRTLLFNIGPADPLVFGSTVVLLAGVALVATYLPARRAMRLDPTIAMRGD